MVVHPFAQFRGEIEEAEDGTGWGVRDGFFSSIVVEDFGEGEGVWGCGGGGGGGG